MLFKSVFFSKTLGQCQKSASEAKNKNKPTNLTSNCNLTDHLREVVCCLGAGAETIVLTSLQQKYRSSKTFVSRENTGFSSDCFSSPCPLC